MNSYNFISFEIINASLICPRTPVQPKYGNTMKIEPLMGLFIVILKMRHVIVLYSKNMGCTTATRHTKAWGAVTLADW